MKEEEQLKVERFAKQMLIELQNNSHKGSILDWKGMYEKIADFEYHKAKMLIAMRTGQKMAMKEYIADCANILLSIGDEANLYEEDSIDTGLVSELKTEVINYIPKKNGKRETNFYKNVV